MDRSIYHTPGNSSWNNRDDQKRMTTFSSKWPRVKNYFGGIINILVDEKILHCNALWDLQRIKGKLTNETSDDDEDDQSGILAKIDYQLASFNVSVSSPVVEFQEGNMNKYFQQLKPYTFIQ
ncbi:hypothetical protein Gotur_022149 [Gossypium turneri]